MTLDLSGPNWQIRVGQVLELLAEIADNTVHCVITSPPYWMLRDYLFLGQIEMPEEAFEGDGRRSG